MTSLLAFLYAVLLFPETHRKAQDELDRVVGVVGSQSTKTVKSYRTSTPFARLFYGGIQGHPLLSHITVSPRMMSLETILFLRELSCWEIHGGSIVNSLILN
jgi:hypothetical protein